jgi:hypothetical protein
VADGGWYSQALVIARPGRWTVPCGVLVAAGLVGVCGSGVSAASSTGKYTVLTVKVVGTYEDKWSLSDGDHGAESYGWTATQTDGFSQDNLKLPAAHVTDVSAHGTDVLTSKIAPNNDVDCVVTGGSIDWTTSLGAPSADAPPESYGAGIRPPDLTFRGKGCPPPLAFAGFLCNPQGGCPGMSGADTNPAAVKTWQEGWDIVVGGELTSLPLKDKKFGGTITSPPGGDETSTISETVTVTAPGVTHAPPTTSPLPGKTIPGAGAKGQYLKAAKAAALGDLRFEIARALYPCLTAGAGVAIFSAPNPLFSVVIGGTLVAVAGPLCAIEIPVLRQLAKVVDDPPLADFTELAPLRAVVGRSLAFPPCARDAAAARAFCSTLQAGATALVEAEATVQATVDTVETTVGRESAALAAGDAGAASAQDHALATLLPKLESAMSAQASAGTALAKLLRSVKTEAMLGPPHAAEAEAVVLAKLEAAGVTRASALALAGSTLQAKTVDALAELGAG